MLSVLFYFRKYAERDLNFLKKNNIEKFGLIKFVQRIGIAYNNTEFTNIDISMTKIPVEEIDLISYLKDQPFFDKMKENIRCFKNKPIY